MSVVDNRPGTTRGGVTGRGFLPGQSGNPGGRPKGLAKRVRELVGGDGETIVGFMVEVMTDETARNADRIEAAKWLGDRGFGRAVQAFDIGVSQDGAIDISMLSRDDLKAMYTIVLKYSQKAAEAVESGELRLTARSVEPSSSRQR